MPPESEARRGAEPRASEQIEPIYRRLPRGPHTLDPRQIAGHQRARIHGAMVEAVARRGYGGVTVRHVISLAGVSRRSFYEQFANRHDCFLKTARTIAASGTAAARREARTANNELALLSALEALAAAMLDRPAAGRLLLAETLAAGDSGALVLGETLSSWEGLLGGLLSRGGGTSAALPAPILRAFAGAVHGRLLDALGPSPALDPTGPGSEPAGERRRDRAGSSADARSIAGELAAHGRALVPAGAGPAQELAARLSDRERRAALAAASAPSRAAPADARERMLLSALRVAAAQPIERVGVVQIADGAGVTIGDFDACFADAGACLRQALASSSRRLTSIAERARRLTGDPAQATRLALAGTLAELAASPVEAHALAFVAHRTADPAGGVAAAVGPQLGEALLGGACEAPTPSAAAGAFWHVVRTTLLASCAPLLPALSDHLAYALLAPVIGSGRAVEALSGETALSGAASGARRNG
jgi:AcrR family transcriptional regulator